MELIGERLPEAEQRELARSPSLKLNLQPADARTIPAAVVKALDRAIRTGKRVQFSYRARASAAQRNRGGSPGAGIREGHLYVIARGRIPTSGEYRADRILPGSLRVLPEHGRRPAVTPPLHAPLPHISQTRPVAASATDSQTSPSPSSLTAEPS
ncbi:MAG: hypothetical protein U0821_26940 [Chloroflexota bacterium]